MAKAPNTGMVPDLSKIGEVRGRLFFLLGAIVVFRIGSYIPVPGIDPVQLAALFDQTRGSILDMFNMFSGGALSRLSIMALGVMPYISASIIVQLMASVIPQLKELKKEGEAGRRTITKYTRYGTLGLAIFQAIGAATALQKSGVAIAPGMGFVFTATVSLVTGTMFLMWLGEQITERGIGNGMSMIIFAGIVAGLPSAIGSTAQLVSEGSLNPAVVVLLALLTAGVTYAVVYVERAQRRIPVHHARRQQGRKLFAAQTQHLPLKLNMSGVIPPIFASSIILFPATLAQLFGGDQGGGFMAQLSNALSPGQALHGFLYAGMIVFFCFFYTALVFDSRETAENLKKSGAFIPGVRPGAMTAKYIDQVLTRLTVAGAAYITIICLMPEFMIAYAAVPFAFGGTSLLITVVVIMDFMAQLQAHLMSHQYDGLLKKANLKGLGGPGDGGGKPGGSGLKALGSNKATTR
ncbi:protein translocase subunit secY/sec61 alpha [Panacagrimonas perspica]|uniref:Protein translocase subunit SecY n=1 Tax=Panacagrimonas perspica TaxID=381431 RepID=A0A4S3K5V1_9GAMM|nr:preprotein translocase subunit SecY [Panacagrimonas perspica]TDU28099.1 protein translocase subunit secY/sec61 alpha [Panacagrimonas perspica]THD03510.1 preprotein translocase subunit SecY [Panacagrimonas perspica]